MADLCDHQMFIPVNSSDGHLVVTRSCCVTVNSSHMRLIAQSTRHKWAPNKATSYNFFRFTLVRWHPETVLNTDGVIMASEHKRHMQWRRIMACSSVWLLWLPCVADADIIFLPCSFFMVALCNRADHYIFMLYLFFSSPNLSGRRLDVYHTLAHGVGLVRI